MSWKSLSRATKRAIKIPNKILLSLLLVSSFIAVSLASAPQAYAIDPPSVVYVRTDGSDANCDGSADGADLGGPGACAKQTIQAGVVAVALGGTVNVATGAYNEQVVIDGKNLTLQGAGDTTIIRPSAPATLTQTYTFPAGNFWAGTTTSSIILVKNAGAVTIKDLKVDGINVTSLPLTGSPDRLVGVLFGVSSGTIDNVTVTTIKTTGYANRTYGIEVSGADSGTYSVEVKNSRVTDWARNGIVADGANLTANIHNNTLVGPGTISGQVANGILFIGGAAGNATSNTISGMHYNAGSFRTAGILVYGATTAGILIDSNDISGTDDGIDLSASSHNATVSNNNLHNNLEVGVQLEDGTADNTITGNTIVNNSMAGIRFGGAGDPVPAEADTPPGAGNVAHSNSFSGNTAGVVNYDTGSGQTFDAMNNWWGSANPAFGSIVSGAVNYTPWYTNPGMTTLSSAKAIIAFSLPGGNGVIAGTNIGINVPFGTDVTSLVPTITFSAGASVSPNTGVAHTLYNSTNLYRHRC